MAILSPYIDTRIETPQPNYNPNQAALEALLKGASIGGESAAQKQRAQQESDLLKQRGQQDEQGKIADLARAIKAQQSGELPSGASLSTGTAHLGTDPTAHNQQMLMGKQISANKAVNDTYNKTLPKLADQVEAIQTGLQSLQNPNGLTAGQLRTNMIRASGMNRYNSAEGGQLLPSTVQEKMSNFLNSLGGDNSTITPQQKQEAEQFYKDHIAALSQRHELLKNNAMSQYPSAILGGQAPQVGSALDKQLSDINSTYFNPNSQRAPSSQPQVLGPMDKLKAFFAGGAPQPASPQMPQAAPQQAPAMVQNAPLSDDEKLDAEIARRSSRGK